MYDILAVSFSKFEELRWEKIKEQYPTAILCENVKSFKDISTKSFTKMFWVIWDNLELTNNINLNEYRATQWDDDYVHIFRNGDVFDGVCLFPKKISISDRELHYRFFARKKDIDIQVSNPVIKQNDIIFLSYDELNAEKNFKIINDRFSNVKRVHGVKGIHHAHIEAAKLAETEMFYVVDGDAKVLETFDFDYRVEEWCKDTVHVFSSINPVNGMIYGYGGIKLLPKQKTLSMNTETTDMTTSISKQFKSVKALSNITEFNTDPFNTWKSAFRECVKLSSKIIARQNDTETDERLQKWCTEGMNKQFGEYSVKGAIAGKLYGEKFRDDPEKLRLINDFEWLKKKFNEIQ